VNDGNTNWHNDQHSGGTEQDGLQRIFMARLLLRTALVPREGDVDGRAALPAHLLHGHWGVLGLFIAPFMANRQLREHLAGRGYQFDPG
jgi:hypothetical protein